MPGGDDGEAGATCPAGANGCGTAVCADSGGDCGNAGVEFSGEVATARQKKSHDTGSWLLKVWNEEENLGGAGDLVETGSLAAQSAEVEELGTANLVGTELLDAVDNLRVVREDALDALAEAHLADGEGALWSLAGCNDHTFEGLEAFFFAFADLDLYADGVAGSEGGVIGPLKFGGELLHNRMNRHRCFPVTNSNL